MFVRDFISGRARAVAARIVAAGLALCFGTLHATLPALADEKITYLFPAPPLLPAFGPIQIAKGRGYFAQAGLDINYAVGRGGIDRRRRVRHERMQA